MPPKPKPKTPAPRQRYAPLQRGEPYKPGSPREADPFVPGFTAPSAATVESLWPVLQDMMRQIVREYRIENAVVPRLIHGQPNSLWVAQLDAARRAKTYFDMRDAIERLVEEAVGVVGPTHTRNVNARTAVALTVLRRLAGSLHGAAPDDDIQPRKGRG